MKLCFVTNYLTHHQLPFCLEMEKRLGSGFTLAQTNPMEEERIRMGWALDCSQYPFVVSSDRYVEDLRPYIMESDAVICGGTSVYYVQERMAAGRLTFRYHERLYKKGRQHALAPGGYIKKLKEHTKYRKAPVYLLCAGAYVPADFSLFFSYPDKMLRFGYFPAFIEYAKEQLQRPYKDPVKEHLKILWTGRQIDWKHAERAILEAGRLARSGVSFRLTLVGEGECRGQLEALARDRGIANVVEFLPFEKPAQVRERMLEADIYLLTSDFQEGWGAALNEAMNAGCAVLASAAAGSVPYLIRHNENGLVYPFGNDEEMGRQLYRLCMDEALRERLGVAAYKTIEREWNASVAAERLLAFCDRALSGAPDMDMYESGPLSPAPHIAPRDGYAYCKGGA